MSTDILEACLERLEDFDYSPPPALLWPGKKMEPPEEGFWIEPRYFPGEPADETWDEGCVVTTGFFYLLVGCDAGIGEDEASELADALVAWFPKGQELGPVRVLKRATRGGSYIDEGSRLYIPVTVRYQGLT